MMRRMMAAVAVMVLGLTGSALAASPAQAVIGCSSGALCFYDSNYSSAVPMVDHDAADSGPNECINLATSYRNKTVYIWNRSGFRWTVYTGINCGATSGPIYANSQGNMSGVYYKTIDSFRRVG
jgi:hypothetical protein